MCVICVRSVCATLFVSEQRVEPRANLLVKVSEQRAEPGAEPEAEQRAAERERRNPIPTGIKS